MKSSGFGEPKSRSPLKAKPLRNPGQSLDEADQRLLTYHLPRFVRMS
jgi:hypothetical protein